MTNPRLAARFAGFFYLVIMVAAPFAEIFVRGGLHVRGDGAATAANILASEQLWRLAFSADVIVVLCDTAVAILLYRLLAPVGRNVSLVAAFFRMALVAVSGLKVIGHLAPLILLQGETYAAAFDPAQVQALSLLSLRTHAQAYTLALVFFGFHCMLIGYLIARSNFLPRILGYLMAFAGVCYLINSFAVFIVPEFSRVLFPWILLPALPAEGGLTLWLLIAGVNAEKWRAQAAAA